MYDLHHLDHMRIAIRYSNGQIVNKDLGSEKIIQQLVMTIIFTYINIDAVIQFPNIFVAKHQLFNYNYYI